MKKSLQSIITCLSLLCISCQPFTPLPAIDIPQTAETSLATFREEYPENIYGDWLYAIDLAQKSYKAAAQSLDNASEILYRNLIASKARTMVLASLEEASTQRSVLIKVAQSKQFTPQPLKPEQLRQVQNAWQSLLLADNRFLHSAVVIAEIRQKLPKDIATSPIPRQQEVYRQTQDLPAVEQIENSRLEAADLIKVCRLLILANPDLMPPSARINQISY